MITKEELESLGFTLAPNTITTVMGKRQLFTKQIDNNHVIPGHDTITIYVTLGINAITIDIHRESSYQNNKEQVFKGICKNIGFFNLVLAATLREDYAGYAPESNNKEPRIAYFPPQAKCWDLMMEYVIADNNQIPIQSIQPSINAKDAFIYSVPEFIKAFNDEHISDQGVILQIIED